MRLFNKATTGSELDDRDAGVTINSLGLAALGPYFTDGGTDIIVLGSLAQAPRELTSEEYAQLVQELDAPARQVAEAMGSGWTKDWLLSEEI